MKNYSEKINKFIKFNKNLKYIMINNQRKCTISRMTEIGPTCKKNFIRKTKNSNKIEKI